MKSSLANEFEKLVKNKFNVYNSLFLNLPFRKVRNVGMLIPLLHHECKTGLDSGKDPVEILDSFFGVHTEIEPEQEKIDFMFRIIQYVERQIVLYDSVEDAAFPQLKSHENLLSLTDLIHLAENKKSSTGLPDKLSSFSARLVLTAHPTQFYAPFVLDIINKLRSLITENDINGIDLILQQLGLTSLINTKKPTPLDEARNIIFFLREVYYEAAGELYAYIRENMQGSEFDNPSIIQLGFWPGGDRDGNPYVTSSGTMDVADELRMNLMKCYYKDLLDLQQKLTFREVEKIVRDLLDNLYRAMFNRSEILRYDEILDSLYQVKESIVRNYNSLYLKELEDLISRVRIFKTHFATLDIRQNHEVHEKVVEEILKRENLVRESLKELKKDELVDILLHKEIRIELDQLEDELSNDTIRTIRNVKRIQDQNGEEGCNRYIISNSEDIYSVLFVYALFRWCGWQQKLLPVDLIPLFESMEGMMNSESIMQDLFAFPEYKLHLDQRGNEQTIMLGFSDGTKDGGYLKANWSIFKTKEKLTALCKPHGIRVIFFDGRGGPPARGGGKTHRFYASQGPDIAQHAIQLTIQGQTITSKYGTKEQFIHNCEQMITAVLSNILFDEGNNISEKSRTLIEELAELSYEKYFSLKNHSMFLPYLVNRSTLKYYDEAKIGSRPAKRGDKDKLDFKDLRAISFVGSWSQLKQNVPGYFGIGTAIRTMKQSGKLDDVKRLFNNVPFFKALVLNSMMALSKCYFELTAYIARDDEYKEFWNILYDEYKLSKEMLLLISGYEQLMEEEPVTRNSIEIREHIVLPLLVIQQYALQKIASKAEDIEAYEKIVRRSLYGNINASRNSA